MGKLPFTGLLFIFIVVFYPPSYVLAQGLGTETNGSVNAVLALQRFQQITDQSFDDGHYARALSNYKRLSKLSDKYSQYRLAVMYLQGLGVEHNLIEAYAWSYVAAESSKKPYVDFHKAVREMLEPQQQDAAREKAGDYVTQYGLFRAAAHAVRLIRREKGQCTGSRVGSTCDRVSGSSLSCNSTITSTPSRSCLILGSVGLPGIIGAFPLDIRRVEDDLRGFLREYNPGRVELGDLELIDDPQ